MKNRKSHWVLWAFISCWLFFLLEIVTDFWFGSKFPGYDWTRQSLSYLGQSGSPIESWVCAWGVGFSLLLVLFSIGFYQTFKHRKWSSVATAMIVVYGLGEGVGSGFYPINPPGTTETVAGFLHNLFSGIGDAGLVLLPFVLMLVFPKKANPGFQKYLWSVVCFGMMMATFFLIAKYAAPDNFILYYKGIWQRLYLLNYHLMLVSLSFKMVGFWQINRPKLPT